MSDASEVKVSISDVSDLYSSGEGDEFWVSAQDHDRIVTELKAEVARQAKAIEKLKGMVSHYETCAIADAYDDEIVPCDCGLDKELEAIEKGEET